MTGVGGEVMSKTVETFHARSGRTVRVGADGTVMFDHANGYLSPASAMDAEEFFQAKHDVEFGRWRCPAEPHHVVREIKRDTFGRRRVLVLNELTFVVRDVNNVVCGGDDAVHVAARAYFEAHPERPVWADAVAVVWHDGAYLPQIAQRDLGERNNGWWWCDDPDGGRWRSEDELAELIGSAEVRVLVATEPSELGEASA